MSANKNPDNGIAYGLIAVNSLDPDLFEDLLSFGTDRSFIEAREEILRRLEAEADLIEDECAAAAREVAYHMSDREHESFVDAAAQKAYAKLGYEDRDGFIAARLADETEHLTIEEPVFEGTHDGVDWRTAWLGGAQLLWALRSPVVGRFQPCSPCAPGAADLDTPCPDGIEGYDVPAGWRARA